MSIAALNLLTKESKEIIFLFGVTLEDTARCMGLLLASAEGFGLRPRLFLPFGQKAFYAELAHFRSFLVPSSNFGNF